MLVNVADFLIEYNKPHYDYLPGAFAPFLAEGNNKPEVSFTVEEADIDCEYAVATKPKSRRMAESSAAFRKLAEWLPYHRAIASHGALFDVDGIGVLLTAVSGTGKTTHMMLWQKLLGERLKIVNGDKPIIRFVGNTAIGFGTPWRGKEQYGGNMKTRLCHICFVERAATNFVEPITKEQAVSAIMRQVYLPKDPGALMATFEMINELLDLCSLWAIHCNMEPEAAEIAYQTIFKNTEET